MSQPKPTLLFLDDEQNILRALERVFFEDEFSILIFQSQEEAILSKDKLEVPIAKLQDRLEFLRQYR